MCLPVKNKGESQKPHKKKLPPHLPRQLEQCHDVESNPGPRGPSSLSSASSSTTESYKGRIPSNGGGGGRKGKGGISGQQQRDSGEEEVGRVDRLEREVMALQRLLTSLDTSVLDLKESIDGMKPAYNQALQVIANTNVGQEGSKNNLIFHGIAPDPLEMQMESEPEFCRDVLETRIKMVFREHLRISRDMPFTQVYRVDLPHAEEHEVRPLVVGFKSMKDKDNILRHSNLLRKQGIFITEDVSGKVRKSTVLPNSRMRGIMGSPKKSVTTTATKATAAASDVKSANSNPTAVNTISTNKREAAALELGIDHLSSCNSDYAPSSHSGNSSSGGGFTD